MRTLNVIFIKEFKNFSSMFGKKDKSDYILNINKIVKDKFDSSFTTPNKVQAFLINYEIRKLLDKAIFIKNEKYNNIIFLNSNLSMSVIENAIYFIKEEYVSVNFNFQVINSKSLDISGIDTIEGLTILEE